MKLQKPLYCVYLLTVVLTFGYVWHRDCDINEWNYYRNERSSERNMILSTACSVSVASAAPFYWPFKLAVTILDPQMKLPSIKFGD